MYAGLQQSIIVIVIIGLEEKENEPCWGKKKKKQKKNHNFPMYTVLLYQAQAMNLLCRSSVFSHLHSRVKAAFCQLKMKCKGKMVYTNLWLV